MKNCAFLEFKNESFATQAQKHLHGLQFLGKSLSVERARTVAENTNIQHGRQEVTSTLSKDSSDGFRRPSEPIAEKLGVDYPFPPHFEYVPFSTFMCGFMSLTVYLLTIASLGTIDMHTHHLMVIF